ncbi:Uncharacterised protein [uncultured archaeon]|nr:Uncharacterised protein [uncultured archaeon]
MSYSIQSQKKIVCIRNKIIAITFLLLTLPAAAGQTTNPIELSGTIIQIVAFLLGMCGSLYLASVLWARGDKGSESWKYLSVSMIMFAFWNIIMSLSLVMTVLNAKSDTDSKGTLNFVIFILKMLDPVIEVAVFMVLLFGLKNIIRTMLHKPWTLFSKVDSDE